MKDIDNGHVFFLYNQTLQLYGQVDRFYVRYPFGNYLHNEIQAISLSY
jgi:hypothetical protein